MTPLHPVWGNLFKNNRDERRAICNLLQGIPLFAGLRRGELREIERLVHQRLFQDREVVFWEGEPGVGMYVIQSGGVAVFQDYGRPGQRELAHLVAGDFFGETALLESDRRPATAVASGETSLLGLIHPELFDLFDRKPHLGVKLLATLADILAQRLRQAAAGADR